MEKKKTDRADLENKKALFAQIGLVLTLTTVLLAFNWKTYDALSVDSLKRSAEIVEEEVIIQTDQTEPPPPPPPTPEVITELDIQDNETEIEDEIVIDMGITEKTHIEAYTAPEPVEELVEEEKVYMFVEEQAEFPGGDAARQKWLAENTNYPQVAREVGIQGTVYVRFVVERDGRVGEVQVARGIGGGCDEEAIRVVKNMPRWAPGKQRGKPVRVWCSLPIRFILAN